MTTGIVVGGHVEPGWEAVAEVFQANFASGEDTGASVSVFHRGVQVVNLWGGSFDGTETPYDDTTLQVVFSTTKGITAIAVAMCVQRGLIDYHEKVSTYWPEFAAHGKGEATVAQLLSHQCGLITTDRALTLEEALDWDTVTAALADTAPEWPIGSGHGYHALTYGWLAGELIRRTDGRTPGEFVRDEIAGPLGVEVWIGLPAEHEPRVAPLIGKPLTEGNGDPAVKAMIEQFLGPETRAGRSLSLGGAFAVDGSFNRRDVHAAEVPAANAITNAGALATVYAATLGPVNGVQLLDRAVVDVARTTVTPAGEADLSIYGPTTFGMGFMTHGPFTAYSGPGSYGHFGLGGSVAFAQPERDFAFAFAPNRLSANLLGDGRAHRLHTAAAAIIDAA